MKPDIKITIYSTPTCVYCKMAKALFKEKEVPYEEKDVAVDMAARDEMIEKSGQLGVPVIDIGDHIIVGFDRSKLLDLIGIK